MAPKADKTPVKKVAKKGSSDKKKKRSKAETYKIYIYKVLKQVRASAASMLDMAVSTRAVLRCKETRRLLLTAAGVAHASMTAAHGSTQHARTSGR